MRLRHFASSLFQRVGAVPYLGPLLRQVANRYPEGSVVPIRSGHGAGLRWRRRHRFGNGYWLGHYEWDIQDAIVRSLAPGAVFYDIGANAGFFSAIAARVVGFGGRVYAFEPEPDNLEALRDVIALNGLSRCEALALAVSDLDGELDFQTGGENSFVAHLGPARAPGERTLRVASTTLDTFVRGHAPPTVVKIDVEGAEGQVLAGAEELIARGTLFLIELHGEECARAVQAPLTRAGYTFEELDGRPCLDVLHAHHVVARPGPRS